MTGWNILGAVLGVLLAQLCAVLWVWRDNRRKGIR